MMNPVARKHSASHLMPLITWGGFLGSHIKRLTWFYQFSFLSAKLGQI